MGVRHAAPALLFAGLAILWTYPLVRHLNTHVPGLPGDNYTFLWNFWWMRQALASSSDAFFHSPHLFAPYGIDLVNHPHTALQAGFAATALGGLPLIAAMNVVILLSVFLTSLSSYWLAYEITRQRAAATLTAVIVGGSPYVSAHLMGHYDLLSVWVLPLTALCLRRALASGGAGWMATVGLSIALAAYAAYYYVVYAALLVVTYVVAQFFVERVSLERRSETPITRWLTRACVALLAAVIALVIVVAANEGWQASIAGTRISLNSVQNPMTAGWIVVAALILLRWRSPVRWRTPSAAERARLVRLAAWSIAAFVVGAAPLIYQAVGIAVQGRYVTQTYFWRSSFPGVDLAAFALGNPFHPWLREALHTSGRVTWFNAIEGVAWVGVVPIALLLWRRRGWTDAREARAWLGVLCVGAIWALGPRLLFFGTDLGLPLPQILGRFVPLVDNARVPGRAMVLVYLSVAILGAMRLASARSGALAPWASAGLLAFLLVDFLPAPIPLTALDQPAIYRHLAAIDDNAAVCVVPFGFGDGMMSEGYGGHEVLYHATLHGHPLVGGFIGRLPPDIVAQYNSNAALARLLLLSEGQPENGLSPPSPAENRGSLPCRYVVFDRRIAAAGLVEYVKALAMPLLASEDGRELYLNERGAK
jgi:hypothetical protein